MTEVILRETYTSLLQLAAVCRPTELLTARVSYWKTESSNGLSADAYHISHTKSQLAITN